MKYYLTTPIYYVNARPHVGSAYTTIAADVLARWHRQKGDDVHFLTGTAEHGTKIAGSAERAGQTPRQFADDNVRHFRRAWEELNINYDDFIRTTESRHEEAVRLFFLKLKDSGQLYEGEYEGLYCVGHEAFVKEADLDERGNCPDHGRPPERIKEKNWFFRLSRYENFLRDKISSGEMRVEPAARRNEVLSLIDGGLEDITVSRRTAKNALPLPWDKSQTVYVWLDELFNYCSAVGYGSDAEKFNHYWPVDVHLIGKDILKFHCIIWPAVLSAIGEEPPRRVFAHGFFTVDGRKISKSLGNAVDPVELVREYGADAVRYYLLRDISFGSDGDFSHARLKDRYNADLANGLGNLVSRVLNMIEQFWPDFDASSEFKKLPQDPEAQIVFKGIWESLDALQFHVVLTGIWTVVRTADSVIEEAKPWELAKAKKEEALKKVLGELFAVLEWVNEALAPFLPDTHKELTRLLEARPLKKPAAPLFARK